MMQPVGVILAGGQARRMGGGDKGMLDLGGQAILAHVIDRLAPQVSELALNANGDPTRFNGFGLPVLTDSVTGFPGPLAGVLAGLDWAQELGASHIVTVAADTPFFPADLVPRLLLASEEDGKPIALAATPDPERGLSRHPTFGLWPVALADDLRAALADGVRKVVAWTDRHGTATARFKVDRFDPFFNVNTPDDLDQARALLGGT
ncbi:MAG: molybdenum cofactor guanylyltransferase MobA [Pseudomonadota bacterium]